MTEEPNSLSHKLPQITVEFDKRPTGISYVVTVFAASSPNQALSLLAETVEKLEAKFGNPQNRIRRGEPYGYEK